MLNPPRVTHNTGSLPTAHQPLPSCRHTQSRNALHPYLVIFDLPHSTGRSCPPFSGSAPGRRELLARKASLCASRGRQAESTDEHRSRMKDARRSVTHQVSSPRRAAMPPGPRATQSSARGCEPCATNRTRGEVMALSMQQWPSQQGMIENRLVMQQGGENELTR